MKIVEMQSLQGRYRGLWTKLGEYLATRLSGLCGGWTRRQLCPREWTRSQLFGRFLGRCLFSQRARQRACLEPQLQVPAVSLMQAMSRPIDRLAGSHIELGSYE